MAPSPILSGDELENHAPEAFHLTDIRALIRKLLRVADEQAQRKLDAAGVLAEDIQKHAQEEGYDAGFAEGHATGYAAGLAEGEATSRVAFHDRAQAVVPLLTTVLHVLEAGKAGLQAEAEAQLLTLALAIATRVVRHEVSLDEQVVTAAVRSAISLSSRRNDVSLHVHPNDAAVIAEELPALHNSFGDLGKVLIVPDPAIERGGVLLKTHETEIDMQIDTQLEAVRRALIGDLAGAVESEADAAGLLIAPGQPDPLPSAASANLAAAGDDVDVGDTENAAAADPPASYPIESAENIPATEGALSSVSPDAESPPASPSSLPEDTSPEDNAPPPPASPPAEGAS